ncbi:hypothetical protein FKR81_23350 [Lentzea tibetensis]|uniref:Uncharacterized protein n=1 Tax=Lentzea tibetensis TaxID=2591470 RepID=A0A563EQ12_9PSEU|nr:hypothetical protein [Lentzea tibetensis]TWP49487.1 hypothetical protein FKR81_23350 [Lentzea tibetensis]
MSQAPYVHPDPDARQLRREYIAKVTEFARRHQPLPEYADVLIAFLADLVLERALLADDLVPLEKSSLQLKPHISTR